MLCCAVYGRAGINFFGCSPQQILPISATKATKELRACHSPSSSSKKSILRNAALRDMQTRTRSQFLAHVMEALSPITMCQILQAESSLPATT